MFPGAMKLKPETAQEITECAELRGMRKRLHEYAYRGGEPLVKAIFDSARYQGLSGEDTMTWMAFEALQQLERYKGMVVDAAMREVHPYNIVDLPAYRKT